MVGSVINSNVTLYAQWKGKPFTFTVYANGGKFADGTTTSKTFTKYYGDYYGNFGLIKADYQLTAFTDSATDYSDNRQWEDSIVTGNKTIYAWFQYVKYFKLKGDVSIVQAVAIRAASRIRKLYLNPTLDTLMECYGGHTILIYTKEASREWVYRTTFASGTPSISIGTGRGFSFTHTGAVTKTVAYLAIQNRLADKNWYRAHFATGSGDANYESSGWIVSSDTVSSVQNSIAIIPTSQSVPTQADVVYVPPS